MVVSNRNLLFQGSIFRCENVRFRVPGKFFTSHFCEAPKTIGGRNRRLSDGRKLHGEIHVQFKLYEIANMDTSVTTGTDMLSYYV